MLCEFYVKKEVEKEPARVRGGGIQQLNGAIENRPRCQKHTNR